MKIKPVTKRSKPVSQQITERLRSQKRRFFSNDNISDVMDDLEQEALVEEVTKKMEGVMQSLIIDTKNDHNAKGTARRFAKMLINETFSGRYLPEPDITDFPNVTQVDELYVVGPITMRSTCAHHWQAITGDVWVGVLPKDNLIGLSKFHRIVNHIATRPQIQEEMAMQIADRLSDLTKPLGLAVLVVGNHLCCGQRGVKDADSKMVSSVMRGEMRTDKSLKSEFFAMVERTTSK